MLFLHEKKILKEIYKKIEISKLHYIILFFYLLLFESVVEEELFLLDNSFHLE